MDSEKAETESQCGYCTERETNPEFAALLKDVPLGYCGLCDICGEPGHLSAHPRLPTSGVWCETHEAELAAGRIFSLGEVIQVGCAGGLLLIIGWMVWRFFGG